MLLAMAKTPLCDKPFTSSCLHCLRVSQHAASAMVVILIKYFGVRLCCDKHNLYSYSLCGLCFAFESRADVMALKTMPTPVAV